MEAGLNRIDWQRPWFAPVRAAGVSLMSLMSLTSLTSPAPHATLLPALNDAAGRLPPATLVSANGLPLRFVPQASLPDGMAYEAFIAQTGQVPTRANLHDFFNALVWLSFPHIKRQLNRLQAAHIAQAGIGHVRGAARDGATLFDENAALLVLRAGPEGGHLLEALRGHQWHRLFVEGRAEFGRHAEVWLFGHALMEKLVAPFKAITAHTWVLTAGDDYFALDATQRQEWIDRTVAQDLAGRGLDTTHFTPLPVLGVPGWWPGQDAGFYQDEAVFRPKRNGRKGDNEHNGQNARNQHNKSGGKDEKNGGAAAATGAAGA